MSESLTTRQAADELGITPRTLRQWLRAIPISVEQDSGGEYRLTRSDLARLSLIRDWRASGKSLRELRERILQYRAQKNPTIPQDEPVPTADAPEAVQVQSLQVQSLVEPRPGTPGHDVQVLIAALVPAVTSAIQEDSRRAERFAQLAHRVGELEATLRERDRELGETREQLAERPTITRVLELEKTIAIQQMELDALREQASRRRPWFAFWR